MSAIIRQNQTSITHRYLEDFLCVIEHLHSYGDLSTRRLSWRTKARLQCGHPEALGGAQPLSGCRRPVGWFDHGDGCYASCRHLSSRLEERRIKVFEMCVYYFHARNIRHFLQQHKHCYTTSNVWANL